MRYLLAIALCAIVTSPAFAQPGTTTEVPSDTVWRHALVGSLNMTQVALSSWQQGGEDAFAYTTSLQGRSEGDRPATNWTTTYALSFGQTQLGEKGLRKTDDKLDLSSVFVYKITPEAKLNPFAAATLVTQFAPGYNYDSVGTPTQVATLFDPAYFTQSIGGAYRPIPELQTRLGAALREVVTNTYTRYSDDPSTPEVETILVEGGLESVTTANWQIEENVLFTSELGLFSPLKELDRITVRSNNSIAAKVSRYINVLLNVQLLNEPRISPRTQIRESLALGVSYTFL